MLAIHLPAEAQGRLQAIAKATGLSEDHLAREAVLEYLEDLEGLHLAQRRLADIRAGKEGTAPLEDVMKRYGMED